MKLIKINGEIFCEGDKVEFVTRTDVFDNDSFASEDYLETIDEDAGECLISAIINIIDDRTVQLCQNCITGANSANNFYGKKYSWYCSIDADGKIATDDTLLIRHKNFKPEVIVTNQSDIDDDPMPDDWEIPFAIPEHL